MKRKHQKYRLCEICYCHPRLNRKLLIIKNSFDEVYKILNSDFCSRKHSSQTTFYSHVHTAGDNRKYRQKQYYFLTKDEK